MCIVGWFCVMCSCYLFVLVYERGLWIMGVVVEFVSVVF